MIKRINISIDQDTYSKLERIKKDYRINVSAICTNAINNHIDRLKSLQDQSINRQDLLRLRSILNQIKV